MPPERQGTQKRRRLPFNPPRPRDSTRAAAGPSTASSKTKPPAKTARSTANAAASSSKSTRKIPAVSTSASASSRSKTPSRSRPAATDSDSESGSRSGFDSGSESSDSDGRGRGRERSFSGEPDYILAEITNNDAADDVMSSEPAIPSKLLTRLLHHHFKSEKTKVAKDANAVVAKYVDVFVREALARAAYERAEGLGVGVGVGGSGGRMSIGDGFLEVEDLEKMAPQLALDF